MSERVVLQSRINVGTYEGKRLSVEAVIKLKTSSRETTTHKHIKEYYTLSITGSYNGGGGQCIDALKKLDSVEIPEQDLKDLIEIWERYHLNDLTARCEHHTPIPVRHDDPEYDHYVWLSGKQCPNGYRYGSSWLITELPQEVIDRVEEIFTSQPKAPSITEEWELTMNGNRGELTVGDIQVTVDYVGKTNPIKVWGASHKDIDYKTIYQYLVTCIHKGTHKTMSFDFFDSIDNSKKPPFAPSLGYSVMCCIRSDSFTTSANYPTLESFCSEFGYDADSRKAEKTYTACIEQGDKISKVFDAELIETLPQ
ncbi:MULTISPECIES: hypothetical protein [unclassified Paenibacillus]|uniref:hypothetical protein n=1 Tax=unclassified Paenibacillus TaxID=185978 RepID=UPI000896484A|nr:MULTISPECIES: hypothetical protein [unclassified Paenibacillus]OMC68686.1 hypothetical protein BK126_12790 [Paenibacillus sp. FSL H7-0326]SDW55004.1 hypothetical protein SAMN05518848_102132 [Paenibacillus sp. PDC88]